MVYIYYISYSKLYLFVDIFYIANDETTANQRENIVIQSMTFCGSSSASNSSGWVFFYT